MIKTAIVGGSGYTVLELLRILENHTRAEVIAVTSRQYKGRTLEDVFPSLSGFSRLKFEDPANHNALSKADLIFSCLPHHTSMEIVPSLLKNGKKVIDLSADFRLKNAKTYSQRLVKKGCIWPARASQRQDKECRFGCKSRMLSNRGYPRPYTCDRCRHYRY